LNKNVLNKGDLNKSALNKAVLSKNTARQPSGLQVRLVALRLIESVIDKKISLDGLTDEKNGLHAYLALEPRDRALSRAIILGLLRHYGTIAAAVARFINRPLPKKARTLHHLIHLTAAQILYLDVPDYAAINLAVTIAKASPRLRRFAALVNALTRQIARSRDEILAASNLATPNLVTNTPSWFVDMLEHSYGQAKSRAILEAQAHEPSLDLTVKQEAALWAEKLSARLLPNGTVRLEKIEKKLTQLPGFANGDWWVQDVAASLPAHLMGDIGGKRVADLCAAPGGKTAQLVGLGGEVTAFDCSPNRMQRLLENMQRLNLTVTTHICDVHEFQPAQLFDAVLCDGPCSSTGTIRRHPDILWTKSLADIKRLVEVQTSLLKTALRFTKPGGKVVFSNCSLCLQEGEELIKNFLAGCSEAELSPIKAEELPTSFAACVTTEGFLRSTPADLAEFGGMDGFFAARLIKL